jgi:hypothetical protein
MAEFDDLVEKLTRTHDVHYQTDDGTKTATVPALLEQLRDEVFGGTERGAASGNKTKLPLNAPAADLYTLIDRQIAEVWAAAFKRVPNADRPEQLLSAWAAWAGEHKIVEVSSAETVTYPDPEFGWLRDAVIWNPHDVKVIDLLNRWVRAIEDMFNPPKTAEIFAACINCGVREVHRLQDGKHVRQTALQFLRDRETGDSTSARCQACGVTWLPSQFKYLAESIAENEKRLKETAVTTHL